MLSILLCLVLSSNQHVIDTLHFVTEVCWLACLLVCLLACCLAATAAILLLLLLLFDKNVIQV
jgi:hypothetical protein